MSEYQVKHLLSSEVGSADEIGVVTYAEFYFCEVIGAFDTSLEGRGQEGRQVCRLQIAKQSNIFIHVKASGRSYGTGLVERLPEVM